MPTRRFSVSEDAHEPLCFALDFQANGKSKSEEFGCVNTVPGAVLLDVLGAIGPDESIEPAALTRFLLAVINEEDGPRFKRAIYDKTHVIDAQTLAEIAKFLIEEYGKRPTVPSSG